MINQFFQLMLMQLREFFRQPGIIFWGIGFPVLMAWGLGVAFTKERETQRSIAIIQPEALSSTHQIFLKKTTITGSNLPVLNIASEPDIEELGSMRIGKSNYLFIRCTWKQAKILVKRGEVSLIMEGSPSGTHFHFDPNNPESKLAYLELSTEIQENKSLSTTPSIKPLTQVGMRYIDFLVPGLMAMGIMMSCMWGVSYALIDKRSKQLLRRMIATPMSKSIFLLSHLGVRLCITAVESLTLFVFAKFYFNIEIQGSLLALFSIYFAGNLAFFGIAILISSKTDNAQIGNGLINLITMPMMIGSGVFFSYHNFPHWMESIIRYLPLTLVADSYRSIFVEGAQFSQVAPASIILVVLGVLTFGAGQRIYKWY